MLTLRAGELEAVFVPDAGLIGCSLRHRGEELLAQRGGLDAYCARGSTFGIPLLHPWANRLVPAYSALGHDVSLRAAPRARLEEHGLPIHGLAHAWPWEVREQGDAHIVAELDYSAGELLDGFPFPHLLRAAIALSERVLRIETTLVARDGPVPVAFGYHPFFVLPGVARARWRVTLPAAQRLALDEQLLPTGDAEPFGGLDGPLGESAFDDAYAGAAHFAVEGGGRRVEVAFERGYPFAQVFAPLAYDCVCFEPMTAPANALATGRHQLAEPGAPYVAAFTIAVT